MRTPQILLLSLTASVVTLGNTEFVAALNSLGRPGNPFQWELDPIVRFATFGSAMVALTSAWMYSYADVHNGSLEINRSGTSPLHTSGASAQAAKNAPRTALARNAASLQEQERGQR